jgi:hypothetical protein
MDGASSVRGRSPTPGDRPSGARLGSWSNVVFVTTGKPRLNRLLDVLSLFAVRHAMSMAITVVFPLPVAIFRAMRRQPGLDCSFAMSNRCLMWAKRRTRRATSASQIAVSTASTWQKKGRTPAYSWRRQRLSRRWLVGVTPQSEGLGIARQFSTFPRISLTKSLTSYS